MGPRSVSDGAFCVSAAARRSQRLNELPVALTELGGWPAVLSTLTSGHDLSVELLRSALGEILSGNATPAQIAGFAIGLRTKGETVEELRTALETMYTYGIAVPLTEKERMTAICTCGTGGDRSHSINVSTIAAFVVAGAGVAVCKHGGRAASSAAGSADVLEALGVTLEVTPVGVAECVRSAGVGFALAPRFHPAMRHAAPVRRELGVATMFNFLGPMANPGRVARQVMGISDPAMAPRAAAVLSGRGAIRALVVFGHDGLDELTTTTTSTMLWVENGDVVSSVVDPTSLGLAPATIAQLRGGSAAENAESATQVLAGELGPHRDIVVLNAAAGLVAAGMVESLEDGVPLAFRSIDSGAAMRALESLVTTSAQYRSE